MSDKWYSPATDEMREIEESTVNEIAANPLHFAGRDENGKIVRVCLNENNPKYKGFLFTWFRESWLK